MKPIDIDRLLQRLKGEVTVSVKTTPKLVQEISKYLDRNGFYTRDYVFSRDLYEVMDSDRWSVHGFSDGAYYSQERLNNIFNLEILANEKSALVMRMDTKEATVIHSIDELSQFLETDKVDYLEGAPERLARAFEINYKDALRPFDCF